ncbi:hypothetical protein BJ994_001056 [Arthrobacter pigmenti]|uniref:SseB protein N-terminal domain-containing protein n=1 Tax=Arthrobacter pigmenti TaxID=271432 RepID=A0A846RJY3_9MICC|nr:hypothetical protein [Arthrobacter pigmenti]
MSDRRLPGHIEAALRASKAEGVNTTDSAGQPWKGRDLSGDGNPLHAFDNDDGGVPASYEAAVSSLVAGRADETAVVRALATVRVFVPVIAELGGTDSELPTGADGHHVGDKEADMALVTIKSPDGRRALPVFTSTARLAHWHESARPVAVFAPRAALSAVAEKADLMVVDPGAEVTFVVRRPALWALAQQTDWVPSYADPVLTELIGRAVEAGALIRRVEVGPGSGISSRTADGTVFGGGGAGPELRISLALEEGLTQEEVRSTTRNFQRTLQNLEEFVERVDSLEIRLTR